MKKAMGEYEKHVSNEGQDREDAGSEYSEFIINKEDETLADFEKMLNLQTLFTSD